MEALGNVAAVICDDAAVRTCKGVPTRDGKPRIECGATLTPDRFRVCVRCDEEIEARVMAQDRDKQNAARKRLLHYAGLSDPFISGAKSLSTIRTLTKQHAEAITAIRGLLAWTPDDGNTLGILIRGDLGTGKSDLAESFIREAVLQGHPAQYVNCRALALALQGAFREDAPESPERIIDRYASKDTALFLALDDLGATKTTRYVADSFYALLERRARNQAPTLIVTNYTKMADLASRLLPEGGDVLDTVRPVDRVEELAPHVITICGKSLRAVISREPTSALASSESAS